MKLLPIHAVFIDVLTPRNRVFSENSVSTFSLFSHYTSYLLGLDCQIQTIKRPNTAIKDDQMNGQCVG